MFNIYYADCIGREGNCLYPHKADVTDAASLAQAVCHDYVCAEYKNSYRSNANFIRSNCLAVEFDNDHSENPDEWVTPEDLRATFPSSEGEKRQARETEVPCFSGDRRDHGS